MNALFLAEFSRPSLLEDAIDPLEQEGYRVIDAYTPYPIASLSDRFAKDSSPVRFAMLAAGVGTALLAYALQVYSAVWAYPINAGGRPLHSWPVFLLVPFEVGIFVAALAGLIAFFRACDLPRLHHPLFAVPGFERASSDSYFLLVEAEDTTAEESDLRSLLVGVGATVSRVPAP